MIARLTGILAETCPDSAVLDVAGVGYLVLASARTLDAIGPLGGTVMLLTEMQVREDSMTLFAFGTAGERESFRSLTSVQGVGGRVALAILSVLDPAELAAAVSRGDKAMVARANGVGPKLAMRIVNELAGKLGNPTLAATAGSPAPRGGIAQACRTSYTPNRDASCTQCRLASSSAIPASQQRLIHYHDLQAPQP